LLANIYGVAKRAAIGLPIEAATTAVGLPGAGIASGITAALTKGKPNTLKAADELLASPEFQKLVIESSNPSNKALRATAKSRSFKKFADAVKIPVDLDARIAWLQNSMQATAQAAEPQVQP
jgi:ABC-type Fe3+ transport system substrate-binding protein